MEGSAESGSPGGPGQSAGPQSNNPTPNSKETAANPPVPEGGLTPEISGPPEKTDTDPQNVTGPEPADALLADAKGTGPHKALENLAGGSLIDKGPITGTPTEGMDIDSRYQDIKKELEDKWTQEHPGKDFLSDEGQNYHLGYINPKDRHLPTLKSDADKLFRERYPGGAQSYDIKEKTRIYDSPSNDPAIRQVDTDILKATNLDSRVQNANTARGIDSFGNVWDQVHARESTHRWNRFIGQYPEKAKAYADAGHVGIQRAFAGRERAKQYQEQQQKVEAAKPKTLDKDDKAAIIGSEEPFAQEKTAGIKVDQGLEQPRPPEQEVAGQPEFKVIDIIDRMRRDDAVDQFVDMPTSFRTLEEVRIHLRGLATEQRRQVQTGNVSSAEGSTARNLLATMYEKIAESDPAQIIDFAQRQKGVCDEKLKAVAAQVALVRPSIELRDRLKGMHQWPNAHLAFDPGFLNEARGPIFEKKVLGEDFINATEGNLHNLGIEQRNLQAVSSKWQQAIELAKLNTVHSSTSN